MRSRPWLPWKKPRKSATSLNGTPAKVTSLPGATGCSVKARWWNLELARKWPPLSFPKARRSADQTYTFKRVVRVIERTIDRHGQFLLAPEITLVGWWTNLEMPPEDVIELYRQHATSEQFHSEFKTDLDLERLPSGKFATNALVMAMGAFAYNILRLIG